MEHEKKRKNKKKKNKQGKTSVPASESNIDANVTKQNHENLNSDSSDVHNRVGQQTILDSDRESISGAETSHSVEADKPYLSKREALLELKLEEFHKQLDANLQREADMQKDLSRIQEERNLWHQKETELEKRILQFETEKDSWLQKEAVYEEKVNHLVEETATLRSIGVNFEEKRIRMEEEKVNSAQRENSKTETIASLSKDNARLRAQVIELEASISDIFHQNRQLKEHVSDLQEKIQDLENSVATRLSSESTKQITQYEDMKSQLESKDALVLKLLSENEKLVEKVNVLNAKLEQKSVTNQPSSNINPVDPMIRNSKVNIDETSALKTNLMPSSAEKLDAVSIISTSSGPKEEMPSDEVMKSDGSHTNHISRVSLESGEIVQISLEENDVTVATSATSVPEIDGPVPLTDAPLIGAPFRLISFVARYVSGADLVQK
uniref:paramyosin isoform X2 n=1 Tax=Erigeron canadensis TaxID=72917 RepID=UPI001CB98AC8|nr:paramyosin isoform X2 [Erigeron canadensis]